MKVSVLILTVLAVGYNAVRIDQMRNIEIFKSCGKRIGYTRKMINGYYVRRDDYPWTVSIFFRVQNYHSNTFQQLKSPGTIISEYHVLGFNPISYNNSILNFPGMDTTGLNGTCKGEHLVLREPMTERFDVDLDPFNVFNNSRIFRNTVNKITILNGCKSAGKQNVLVLELKEPLPTGTHDCVAACVSDSPNNWMKTDQFSVFGLNRQGMLVSGSFAPSTCWAGKPLACAKATKKNQGLCQGDFGGSAIANLDDRYTALGIYVNGNIDCRLESANLSDFRFINLGFFAQEICDVTGVCPPQSYPVSTPETPGLPPFELPPLYPFPSSTPGGYMETTEQPEYNTTPDETAETRGPEEDTTTTRATTAPRIGAPGEVIVAETYEQMPLGGAGSPEVINAERIAPMQIGNVTGNGTEIGGIGVNTVNINVIFH